QQDDRNAPVRDQSVEPAQEQVEALRQQADQGGEKSNAEHRLGEVDELVRPAAELAEQLVFLRAGKEDERLVGWDRDAQEKVLLELLARSRQDVPGRDDGLGEGPRAVGEEDRREVLLLEACPRDAAQRCGSIVGGKPQRRGNGPWRAPLDPLLGA